MVYYLKANTLNNYTYNNIINWINIIAPGKDSTVYLLCDNEEIVRVLLEMNPDIKELVNVIQSERDELMFREIAQKTLADSWYPAGFAHLTTFLHAARNGYESFWNIDADDTFFRRRLVSQNKYLEVLNLMLKKKGFTRFLLTCMSVGLGGGTGVLE